MSKIGQLPAAERILQGYEDERRSMIQSNFESNASLEITADLPSLQAKVP